MKRTLFLSILGLASLAHADVYSFPVSYTFDSIGGFPYNLEDSPHTYVFQIIDTPWMGNYVCFRNAANVHFTEYNYWYYSALQGNGGTYFLNTSGTSLGSYINYQFKDLYEVSFKNYTGYKDTWGSSGYGLIAGTAHNQHQFLFERIKNNVIFDNNTLTSDALHNDTSPVNLRHLYSSVLTTIDSINDSRIELNGYNNYGYSASASISGNKTIQLEDGSSAGLEDGAPQNFAYAGAIYASGKATVSITNYSSSAKIADNLVQSAGSNATGGAIAMHGDETQSVNLSSNGMLNLDGNKAVSTWSNPCDSTNYITAGGAIYAPDASVSINSTGSYQKNGNEFTLSICGNSAQMDNGNVRGGAIDARQLTITQSTNSVLISGNSAIHTDAGNRNAAFSASGGALSAVTSGGTHSITETGKYTTGGGMVVLYGNYAQSGSETGIARGGFFYGADDTTLEISDNGGEVHIMGNYVSAANTDAKSALGGAIYGSSLKIEHNNSNVYIYGNYEQYGDTIRRRAIYLSSEQPDSTLSLSARQGTSIYFDDAIYANVKNIIINGSNDDDATQGQGRVVFSGTDDTRPLYISGVTDYFNPAADNTNQPRTSYFGSTIKVQGGTLEACNGALLQGIGMEVAANSNATVRLNSAAMQHSGGIVRFYESTTLAAAGSSTLEAGELQMSEGSGMLFELTSANADTAALTYTGDLSLTGTINLTVKMTTKNYKGGTLKMLTLNSGSSNWEDQGKSISYSIANGKLMGTTSWDATNSTMLFTCWEAEEGKKITWSGNGCNPVWDNMSDNWSYDGKGLSYTGTNDIHFEDDGAGELTIKGAITTGNIFVNNSAGKDYTWIAADATSKITGSNGLTKNGAGILRIKTAMDYTGTTEVQNGRLVLEKDSTLNGSFINNAEVEIASHISLKKYSGQGITSIGEAGSLSMGRITVTKGAGQADAELQGSADAGEYSIDNEKYEIRNGKVTATGSTKTVIKNKLTHTGVVNNSTNTLELQNSGNTLSSVEAIKGNVNVFNKATHEMEQLIMGDNRTVGFFKYDDDSVEATITITKAAQFGKDTTLLADFELKSGASLMMTDTVTMGSEIILNAGAILEGDAYDKAFTLTDIGTKLVLFDSVNYLILKQNNTVVGEFEAGDLTTESKVLASTYFKNLSSRNDLYITFDNLNGGQVSLTVGEALVVPEPATATLSLLALAAMAARRRRR